MSQSPMISVPLKRTDEVDWVTPLKRYIAVSYQDDPDKYAEETGTIHRLRQDMRGAGNDTTGRDVLYRYFGQLEILDLRFPVDEAHIKIGFMWYVCTVPPSVLHHLLLCTRTADTKKTA